LAGGAAELDEDEEDEELDAVVLEEGFFLLEELGGAGVSMGASSVLLMVADGY